MIHDVLTLVFLLAGGTAYAVETSEIKSLGAKAKEQEKITSEAEAKRTISKYQASITALEQDHGAYHDQLSQELLGLGLSYRNQGQHSEAIAVFKRSLHISRINQGLHNSNQLPILELIIETNTALSAWEALDQNYHYLYWVNLRNYGANDPRFLPVLDRVGRWHLNAYDLQSKGSGIEHLLDADALYSHAVRLIEAHFRMESPRLIDALYGVALANYQLAAHAGDTNNIQNTGPSYGSGDRRSRLIKQEEARQELIYSSYRKGKKAIQRIVDIYTNNPWMPAAAHANALMHLGDWYLLFNKSSTAMKHYEQAQALVNRNSIDNVDVNNLLAHPRSLPAMQFPLPYKQEKDENESYVIASFDVTKTGKAKNIRIIESNPADSTSLHRRAKKTIKSSRFRPRFENGEPVATSDVNVRYVFPD